MAKTFGDGGARLSLRIAGDPTWLRKDDYIRPRIVMADFRGEIRVDYLDRQGNVMHMYPQLADPKAKGMAGTIDARICSKAGRNAQSGRSAGSQQSAGWQVDELHSAPI